MDTAEPIEHDEDEATEAPSPASPGRGAPSCDREPDSRLGPRNDRRELQADEAERLLRLGREVKDVRIVGRLRLRGEFDKPVRLSRVEAANLLIEDATFAAEVALVACRLARPIIQRKVVFGAGLSLEGSELSKLVKVDNVEIRGRLNARKARFAGKLVAIKARFAGPADFWEATFDDWANFKACRFDDTADFRSTCAEEGVQFQHCHFAADFLFRGASVGKKAEFNDSTFEGLIDLSKAKLHDFAYLESVALGPGARFAFWNAVAERVQIRPEQVEGRLASERDGDHARAASEYGLLKRNFEALHRHEEEDWAFYRFKVNERRSKPRSWRRPWSKLGQGFEWLVLDLGCRYGTSPFRTVAAASAMILAFSLVYMAGVESLPIGDGPAPFDGAPTTLPNRVVIGLVTSVSAFTDGLGSLRETARGWMNLFLVAESLLGTLVWGLFIVAFSRKVIR
ncbi:pentapeptide repeat-containing protein [Tautonia plasticadhaerens]|uniref:Pentapeptide repeats (8 copies) n=1 Tax=Tautonia plasticadhaerens TaxID=2527974 RepID=A0A518GV02_9BACT|nr:pentapeptide repeat-containing protein [Tautonia plasticadhaerens]QDV32411.1 hypothetical protein ElP_02430 [Tautonia plasticadhaerens]